MKTENEQNDLNDIVVRCENLVVKYGDLVAVNGLDLCVKRGECLGLLGPNGAGKTTTVEVFEGLTQPSSGKVALFDTAWGTGNDRALRSRFGVALQETMLSEKLTVFETVRLFASFYKKQMDLKDAIELLGLTDKTTARVGTLSGGQKQRLSLACALVGQPELLFLDEPTTGLDPKARFGIWDIVENFVAKGGTVLITTHYMEEAARLCDRVAIIDDGKLIALDTVDELIQMLGAKQVIEYETGDLQKLENLLKLTGVSRVTENNGKTKLIVDDVSCTLKELLALAEKNNVTLQTLSTHRATLDDVFVQMTGKGLSDV